ncbi:MAG: DUF4838 domain-containing protein [Planctomycetes bacterium]|nr:DUF4838 domain-containing protein [Planctomycetota bacterium]
MLNVIRPLLALMLLASALAAAEPAKKPTNVALARGGKALHTIVVPTTASDALKATAADLSAYLGKLSGAAFTVAPGASAESGIVLGRGGDFAKLPVAASFKEGPFAREDYVLRAHAKGLCLIGASDLAVSHAAWDLLQRLGHRQFFPGETWEVLPPPGDLAIAVDVAESPSFAARRIWYNWGTWGYNDVPYRDWCVRNRMAKGFDLNSGHAYEAIIAANAAEFEKHPEYLALNGKERRRGGDAKFCVANPGLRTLVADHAVRVVRANPAMDSVSMDPSDGGNWCECADCAKLGSVSNRVVTLANGVAEAINALGLGAKYVGTYAYNQHSAPPDITVHPNVIISATTAFIGGGFTFGQVVEGWQAKGATVGVYDYLSVVDWDWNLPRGSSGSRPRGVAAGLARFHQQGARFYDAESGDCWGPCGLGYLVASRVLWNVDAAKSVDAIVDDFIKRAFPGIEKPMRGFYELICFDDQRRQPSDLVGRMYRCLDEARRATKDAKVLKRIDDLVLYTRHAELYYALQNGAGSVDAVAGHDYRIRKTMMVHAYGLWARLLSQQAAHTDGHPLKNETPFSSEEIGALLATGIAANQPVDPGFAGVSFSRDLVPAAKALKLPSVAPGYFPQAPQDNQQYWVWLDQPGSIDLKITVQRVWMNRQPKLTLFSPLEVRNLPVATDESYKPDGQEYAVKVASPFPGIHRIETVDGGDHTRIAWPTGMPVTLETGVETANHIVTSHFRGGWTMYFYVPKGTKTVGGWAARIANWASRINGTMRDADGTVVHDFGAMPGDGWFNVPVAAGQDGRLWSFNDGQGQRLLMTVPPYVARTAEELLLPAEVVKADRK